MKWSERFTMAKWVDDRQASGRYTFTHDEAATAVRSSPIALKNAIRRLVAKGRLAVPRRGFYVIVPLEYAVAGAPPASWFIDDFMRFQDQDYYVALLSAAAIFGAAHQQPQEFQVVTDTQLRPAVAGRGRIQFFLKRHLELTPTTKVKTETGSITVSTPEATALDLVRYPSSAGHLGNVATVLAELSEKIDPDRLVQAARSEPKLAYAQRLGYLLDLVGAHSVVEPFAIWVAEQTPNAVPLRPARRRRGLEKDPRWQVLVNEEVKVDV
jgi:predicted transcriptional regulator of viral defense system